MQKEFMKLAEAFLIPFEERTAKQKKLTNKGICQGLRLLGVYQELCDRIYNLDRNYFIAYWLPTRRYGIFRTFRPVHDIYRGTFCLLMATAPKKYLKNCGCNKQKGVKHDSLGCLLKWSTY